MRPTLLAEFGVCNVLKHLGVWTLLLWKLAGAQGFEGAIQLLAAHQRMPEWRKGWFVLEVTGLGESVRFVWVRLECSKLSLSFISVLVLRLYRNVCSLEEMCFGGNFFLNNCSCLHNQISWLQISEQQVAIKFSFPWQPIFFGHFDLSSGLKLKHYLCCVSLKFTNWTSSLGLMCSILPNEPR